MRLFEDADPVQHKVPIPWQSISVDIVFFTFLKQNNCFDNSIIILTPNTTDTSPKAPENI